MQDVLEAYAVRLRDAQKMQRDREERQQAAKQDASRGQRRSDDYYQDETDGESLYTLEEVSEAATEETEAIAAEMTAAAAAAADQEVSSYYEGSDKSSERDEQQPLPWGRQSAETEAAVIAQRRSPLQHNSLDSSEDVDHIEGTGAFPYNR